MTDTVSETPTTAGPPELEGLGKYQYGWADSDSAGASARRGLSEDVVRNISALKTSPSGCSRCA